MSFLIVSVYTLVVLLFLGRRIYGQKSHVGSSCICTFLLQRNGGNGEQSRITADCVCSGVIIGDGQKSHVTSGHLLLFSFLLFILSTKSSLTKVDTTVIPQKHAIVRQRRNYLNVTVDFAAPASSDGGGCNDKCKMWICFRWTKCEK